MSSETYDFANFWPSLPDVIRCESCERRRATEVVVRLGEPFYVCDGCL